jgi:hypothetical protein
MLLLDPISICYFSLDFHQFLNELILCKRILLFIRRSYSILSFVQEMFGIDLITLHFLRDNACRSKVNNAHGGILSYI